MTVDRYDSTVRKTQLLDYLDGLSIAKYVVTETYESVELVKIFVEVV